MTDRKQDIVERLRAVYDAENLHDLAQHMVGVKWEAAAEIERLRAIVASQERWVPKPYCAVGATSGGSTVRSYSLPRGFVEPRCPVKIHEVKGA